MNLIYQISDNLFLEGDKIISYDSHVATIKNGVIHELGNFSKTTTKHIHTIAGILRIPVSRNSQKSRFVKHEFGVKFKIENSLSPQLSHKFLSNGISTRREIWHYISEASETSENIGRKDWEILKKVLNLEEDTPHPRLKMIKWEIINSAG